MTGKYPVDKGIGGLHAEAGEDGLDECAFAYDDGLAIACQEPEEDEREDDCHSHERDVHYDLHSAEFGLCLLRQDVEGAVGREYPALADDLQADAYRREDDGGKAESYLYKVICRRGVKGVEKPDGRIDEISEYQYRKYLQHVLLLPDTRFKDGRGVA